MWSRLARLPWVWRCLAKWFLLALVATLALYPRPGLLVKQVRHLCQVELLIQPELPEIRALNREIDALLATNAARRDELRVVEGFVYRRVPYQHDWINWGNLDYWPTAAEVLARQREDCDGRAVLATSILRARGFTNAQIVANLNHVWVTVDQVELLGPQKEKSWRRVGGKTVVTVPGLRSWLGTAAMLSEFPALRSLLILATALVLAYHPCRNVTGLLAVTVLALVGFLLVLDWGHRLASRSDPRLSAQLVAALALLLAALAAALSAGYWSQRLPVWLGSKKPAGGATARSVKD